MQIAPYNPTYLTRVVELAESILEHRRNHPLNKSDEMYYSIIADYYRTVRDAHEMGKKRVYYGTHLPAEIFHAMDIAPAIYEPLTMSLSTLGNAYEEALASAKAFGIAAETCSVYRLFIGAVLSGWFPKPDALVYSPMLCDNVPASSEIIYRLWGCQGHYVDRGYFSNDREIAYFVDELKSLIGFLEGITGRKMDYDRLSECMARTREVMLLERELEELKKATPTPMRSRAGTLGHAVGLYMHGTQAAVDFFRQMRDEAKELVAKGEGLVKEQKYRLLLMNGAPAYDWKIIDWLEKTHNAVIAYAPFQGYWEPGDFDPSKPLEALAIKTFRQPQWAQWGPVDGFVDDVVRDIKEYKIDGLINFVHVSCRQCPQFVRRLKDRVVADTDVPYFSIETDLVDPSFVSGEEMRGKLDEFFEMIDERRAGR